MRQASNASSDVELIQMFIYRDDVPNHISDQRLPSLTLGAFGKFFDLLHCLRCLLAVLVALACTQVRADERPVSFDRDVMAVLSKAGCNRGACHGNRAGKGGLQLSLRGEDAASDYERVAREFAGRRVNIQDPAASLILLKPSGGLAHEGGVRFDTSSLQYSILLDWLEEGATRDVAQASLTNLTVTPAEIVVENPQQEVQLKVTATFADGERRDVTQLACYEMSNLVAVAEPHGLVRRNQDGETTVLARYLNLQVPARIAYVRRPQATDLPSPDAVNYIDELIDEKLKSLHITPSLLCTDSEFVRRAYLDATGLMPTGAEAQAFVGDQRPDKRSRLIDQLLERKEFAELWALKFGDVFRNEEKVLDPKGVKAFHAWLRDNIAEDQPLNRTIHAMLVGLGSTYENAPANFYRAHRTPSLRAETAARLFLGVRLECAKCHNHPFDRWTQEDYYSWTAWFAGIDYEIVENKRKDKLDKNEFRGEQIVKLKKDAEIKNPATGRVAPPRLLGDETPDISQVENRLIAVADWVTSPKNTRFAQIQANFVWYHVMGRGLVEPIDDFRPTNPSVNPPLLEALADDFRRHEFRLKHLVRTMMNSRTYQLSSFANETNRDDQLNFSRSVVYRLQAEKLADAISQLLDVPAEFSGYDHSIRAGQLPGVSSPRRAASGDRFLATFGKPERLLGSEYERSNETTLSQALMLIGSRDLQQRLVDDNNFLDRLAESDHSNREIVDQLYWAALSRPPSESEFDIAETILGNSGVAWQTDDQRAWAGLLHQTGVLRSAGDRFDALQDLAWALINSKEFLFRH